MKKPVFITARFRTGSTLLWNMFRQIPEAVAFYEPLHEQLPALIRNGIAVQPRHFHVDEYFREYPDVGDLERHHRPEFGVCRLHLEALDEHPELKEYIRYLIDIVPEDKTPVLQFNRLDFRLPWIRENFPDALLVHLWRCPRDQWVSTVEYHRDAIDDRPDVDPYRLTTWARSLCESFPFLASPQIRHIYQRHFYLWKLSFLAGSRLADLSLAYDDLLENPEQKILDLLHLTGFGKDHAQKCASVVCRRAKGQWKKYRTERWFAEMERECEDLLEKTGLNDGFALKPLSEIVEESPVYSAMVDSGLHRQWSNRAGQLALIEALNACDEKEKKIHELSRICEERDDKSNELARTRLAEQHAEVIRRQQGDLVAKEEVIQSLRKELEAKQALIGRQEGALADKEAVIRSQKESLAGKEALAEIGATALESKEKLAESRRREIETLHEVVCELKAEGRGKEDVIQKQKSTIAEKEGKIASLQKEVSVKEEQVSNLIRRRKAELSAGEKRARKRRMRMMRRQRTLLAGKDKLICSQVRQLAGLHAALGDQSRRFAAKNKSAAKKRLQFARRHKKRMALKNGVIRKLTDDLVSQKRESFREQEELFAKEAVIQSQHRQLVAKEEVIRSLLVFRRTSLRYWTMTPLYALYQLFFGPFRNPLEKLRQHAPLPLSIPGRYRAVAMPKEKAAPSVSIVTPSLNQADFIERTIKSVVDQQYPNLEYIVQDGGSTDGTDRVLEKYRPDLSRVESRKDKGQSNAINLGFEKTGGEIMAWLNSDDMLLPGSIAYVASFFMDHPEIDAVYGHRVCIDENDDDVGRWVLPPHDNDVLLWADYVPQETLFWRRRIWEKSGGHIDESFRFAMDWDLLLRFRDAGAKFARLPRFLGAFRVHDAQKTLACDHIGQMEMERIRTRCHGRPVTWEEINRNIRKYQKRSAWCERLYRTGVFRY